MNMRDDEPGLEPKGTCYTHNVPLIWESGGEGAASVFGRYYCPKCQEDLMRVLDRDAKAVSGEEPYELHHIDDVIAELASGALIFDILTEHVGSATEFCVACPGLTPTRDETDELPEERWWIRKHQAAMIAERLDDLLCDALSAGDERYDGATMGEHLEALIERMREEHPSPRSVTHDA